MKRFKSVVYCILLCVNLLSVNNSFADDVIIEIHRDINDIIYEYKYSLINDYTVNKIQTDLNGFNNFLMDKKVVTSISSEVFIYKNNIYIYTVLYAPYKYEFCIKLGVQC